MLCPLIKEFESFCEEALEEGRLVAERSRAAHKSQVSSAMHEPSITQHLIFRLSQLRSNHVHVFVPPEGKTGGDIEIHVKLPGSRWVGLIIQAKRVQDTIGDEYIVPELNHRDGAQYRDLIAFSEQTAMLPCYLFYVPSGAVEKSSNRSGAMICNARQMRRYITEQRLEADPILAFSRKLSTVLCFLDEGREQQFLKALENVFHVMSQDGMPKMIGGQPPPEYIISFINGGVTPPAWLRQDFAGALVIDLAPEP